MKLLIALLLASPMLGQVSCSSIPLGFNLYANGGSLAGFVPFPSSAYWHRNITAASPSSTSADYIDDIRQGGDRRLRAIYPPATGEIVEGFFYYVVDSSQPRINTLYDLAGSVVHFTNGSATATWVSGYQFDPSVSVPFDVLISARPSSTYIVSPATTETVTAVGSTTSLTISAPFSGVTGDYPFNLSSIPTESDPGPMPIPIGPVIQGSLREGYPVPDYASVANNDGHVFVVDRDQCVLYELFNVTWDGHSMHAGTGAIFDLLGGDQQRPIQWTSTSVSGLPIFPGMLRTEEIRASSPVAINHPLSISAFQYPSGSLFKHHSWILPASHHQYGPGSWGDWWHSLANGGPTTEIPIGSLIRLKPGYNISGFPPQSQIILQAMKDYGAIIIDGGNTIDLYSSGSFAWNTISTATLYTGFFVEAGTTNFEVITSGNDTYCDPLYSVTNAGRTPPCPFNTSNFLPTPVAPTITTPVATPSHTAAGGAVTLTWTASGASSRLRWVTPQVGVVVADTAVVYPRQTTTYTARVCSFGGCVSDSVTVTVP